jgi:hypothetical protein
MIYTLCVDWLVDPEHDYNKPMLHYKQLVSETMTTHMKKPIRFVMARSVKMTSFRWTIPILF